jgi:hypothetical protein
MQFVLAFGVVSMLADFVYEGARAIVGPYLATLGASAALVGAVTGFGEAAALVLRLATGPISDRTQRHWALSIAGYLITVTAVPLLDHWREDLEQRLRGGEEHPALEAHLAKYRSLVPSLALVLHLTDRTEGPVDTLPLVRAIAWAEYLETHARRIYPPAISLDMDAARALAKRIKGADVAVRIGLREVYNRGWSGLSTRNAASAAVQVLIDHHWLQATEEPTAARPRTVYWVNPAVLHGISAMSVLDRVREKYKTPDLATCKTSKSPSAGFAGSPGHAPMRRLSSLRPRIGGGSRIPAGSAGERHTPWAPAPR